MAAVTSRRRSKESRVSAISNTLYVRDRIALPPVTGEHVLAIYLRTPQNSTFIPRPHVASPCLLPSARGETPGQFHFGGQQQKTSTALVMALYVADTVLVVRLRRVDRITGLALGSSHPTKSAKRLLTSSVPLVGVTSPASSLRAIAFLGFLHRRHCSYVVFNDLN